MKNVILILLLGILFVGCGDSTSYNEGKQMADRTYGSMPPDEMIDQSKSIMSQIQSELENAGNKKDWWNGFCDRGEEIWLERIDQINEAMGQKVLNPDQIKSMFGQMRSSFKE